MKTIGFAIFIVIASAACTEIIIDLDSDLLPQYRFYYQTVYTRSFAEFMENAFRFPEVQLLEGRMDEIKVNLAPFTRNMVRVYSEITGYTENQILAASHLYEALCTTAIVKKPSGGFLMGRNLDYSLTKYLKKTFMETVLIKNGRPIIKGAGFFGFVGFLNASYYNQYSVSVNQRSRKAFFDELLDNLINGAVDPVFYLYESILTSHTYHELYNKLATRGRLAARAYFVLCGNRDDEAVVIGRGSVLQTEEDNYIERMNPEDWFLVQANDDKTDCKTDPVPDRNRKCTAEKNLRSLGRDITPTALYTKVMSLNPNNYMPTIYISIQDHNSFQFYSLVQ